jgi:hypothetical protein
VTHDYQLIDEARSVAVHPATGMITIVGLTTNEGGLPGHSKFHVARFTDTGTFHDQISSNFPNTEGDADAAWGVAIDSQGRIIAGGYHTHEFEFHPVPLAVQPIIPAFAAIRLCDTLCVVPPGGSGSPGENSNGNDEAPSFAGTALVTLEPAERNSVTQSKESNLASPDDTLSGPLPEPDLAPTSITSVPEVPQESAHEAYAALDQEGFLELLGLRVV